MSSTTTMEDIKRLQKLSNSSMNGFHENDEDEEVVHGLDVNTEVETLMEGEEIIMQAETGDTKQLDAFSKKLAEMPTIDLHRRDVHPWERVTNHGAQALGMALSEKNGSSQDGSSILAAMESISLSRRNSITAEIPNRKISMVYKVPTDPHLRKLYYRNELVKQHFIQVENRLFEMFGDKDKKTININKFLLGLISTGLRHDDPRLKEMRENLKRVQEHVTSSDPAALSVDYDTFMSIIQDNIEIVVKAFSSSFVIPDFRRLCCQIDEMYHKCQPNKDGKVASYITQLSRESPEHWAVSVCTVDGQRYSIGDVSKPFTIQSCSKPLNYAIAAGDYGSNFVHNFVGMEPSGRYFNELCLDFNNKPHNPMINAGAIMVSSLIKKELSAADRFDYVFNTYKRLTGGEYLGFNNAVFLSERECADRNFALAYFMRENKCFPEGTRLHETLDFYFQLCSLEITAESGAVIAATLANGGINPLTADPVLTNEAVRNTLTLMHSCGMYNYSGQFAFKVGLPSKSGVSGCVLLVIPNTLGICLWSPPLDVNGNSVRGVEFCMELVNRFTFHHFDNLRGHVTTKQDPRMAQAESRAQVLFDLLFSVAAGDLSALRRHSLSGSDMEASDYDGRTALHVAASEGHAEVVDFLLENCQVNPLPQDRWGRTPLDDAAYFGHPRCAEHIKNALRKSGTEIPTEISTVSRLTKEIKRK